MSDTATGRTWRRIPAFVCCVVAFTACADRDGGAYCADVPPGTVVAGMLPAEHADVQFTELWRVAGTDEDTYMSTPLSVALSREGRAAIADFELGEVFVVEPDGTWSGRIARKGMGPGELSSPVAAVWDDAGGLHVYDLVKPAIVHFSSSLAYAGEERAYSDAAAAIFASGSLNWAGVQPGGGTVLIPSLDIPTGSAAATEVVLRVAPTGHPDTLRTGTLPIVRGDEYVETAAPGYPRIAAATGAGGRLAVIGGDDGWLLDVYDGDGTLALTVCAEPPAQPLTDGERGRGAAEEHREFASAFAAAVPPSDPARFGRVVAGADGTIWVQRERRAVYPERSNLYGDAGTVFDVFGRGGEYVRTLKLPTAARLQGALGDTIWAYESTDLDEVYLVAYEIH